MIRLIRTSRPRVNINTFPRYRINRRLNNYASSQNVNISNHIANRRPRPINARRVTRIRRLLKRRHLSEYNMRNATPLPGDRRHHPSDSRTLPKSNQNASSHIQSHNRFRRHILLHQVRQSATLHNPNHRLFRRFLQLPQKRRVHRAKFDRILSPYADTTVPTKPHSTRTQSYKDDKSTHTYPY